MADKLQFDLVSPERQLMSQAVDMVVVPGADGEFGVLARHAPMMSTIRPGFLRVHEGSGAPKRIFVRGGFAEVTPEGLTVLAEHAVAEEDIDRAAIEQSLKDAREDVADAKTDEARQVAQQRVDDLQQVLDAL